MATEKRLIDANALLLSIRTTLVRRKQKYAKNPIISDILDSFDKLVIGKVKKAQTVDAVEVVRCKDCKRNNMNGGDCNRIITMYHYDPILELNVAEHIKLEHCSYGERRTDD